MKILRIEAGREVVRIVTDFDGAAVVRECVATIGTKPGRTLSTVETAAVDGVITLPRFENVNDRLFSHYTVFVDGQPVEGICYVTDIDEDVPEYVTPYPQPAIIKTLQGTKEVMDALQIPQSRYDVNLPTLMCTRPAEGTIPYVHNGKTYYFIEKAIQHLDDVVSAVPMLTMILLNSPFRFGSTREKALLDAVIHPGFDWDYPDAYISAFDMQTEDGQGYYGAFVEFLAERYSRPDHKYGHVAGFIISNEVCSQYVWGNAGEMPVEQYVREYTQAMRYAWLCGRKHCSHVRVYMSLDQFWSGTNFNTAQPLRYYSGRKVLDLCNEYAAVEGNFDWGLAYHPYPEDLRCPDFWNDRAPNFTFDTPKVTFKNIEVLEAYLAQPAYLYKGQARRIIFSEQGFNSQNGVMQEVTEKQAAAAYVLAYMKSRNMKTVDMMTHHAFIDNPDEFGLNLGIFRYDPNAPHHMGEAKPIFESVKAMDTPDEAAAVEKARAFIGADLFDLLLNPPVQKAEEATTLGNIYG